MSFFVSVQFLILFRLIALFVWYSILFIRLYFASKRPLVVKNIYIFCVIFNQTWKQQSFRLKFYTFFLYFSNEFFIVFNFYFDWIYFCFIFETLLTSYRNKINRFCLVFRPPLYCPSYRTSQYRFFGLKLSVSHSMFHIFVWWLCCTPLKYLLARRILFFLLTSYQNKSINPINSLFPLPNCVSCRQHILSIISILFLLTFDIWRFSSHFPGVFLQLQMIFVLILILSAIYRLFFW